MKQIISADRIIIGFLADGTPEIVQDQSLLVESGVITGMASAEELRREHPDAAVMDGKGKVIIPGLVNAHHHVGLTPLQLGSPDHPLETWFASRLALRDVDLRLDTLFSAFEMIASGVTTVQHLHSRAPGTAEDVVRAGQTVMEAYRSIGMRASYSMALRDQNRLVYEDDATFTARLPSDLQPDMADYFRRFTIPLSEQVTIFKALLASVKDDSLIKVQLAPANLHWLSDKALETAGSLSQSHDVPMHIHLVETPYQREYAKRRTGGTALEHLHRFGLTGQRLTLGHGVWMSAGDIDLCAETGTHICHNCSSNFRLKSGLAPVNRFLAKNIPVAIGIDEAGINDDRDMLQEMRMVLRAHRQPGIDTPSPTPAQVLRMATQDGAATTPFGDRIGHLRVGAYADLVLLDWHDITYPYQDPALPLVDVIVQRAKTSAVRTVMIAGETVYQDGRFTRIDRGATLAEIAARMAQPLTEAEEKRRQLSRAVFPHVKAFYDGWLD